MDAKALSVKMGFNEFMSRHDRSIATSLGLETIQKIKVANVQRKKKHSTIDDVNAEYKNIVNNDISCNNQNKRMYFIGHDSKVWPCCFLHNGFMNMDRGKADILQKRLFDAYGSNDWNDLSKHSVEEVLAHDFYKSDLVSSWKTTDHGTGATDRIHRCTEVCNVKTLEVLPIGNYKLL
jgi:hypothetical protein